MRLTINTLVLEKKDFLKDKQYMNCDEMRAHTPTKEEIASLGLSNEDLKAIKEFV